MKVAVVSGTRTWDAGGPMTLVWTRESHAEIGVSDTSLAVPRTLHGASSVSPIMDTDIQVKFLAMNTRISSIH